MSRFTQFLGVVGLVLFLFGVTTYLLPIGEGGLFAMIHTIAGATLLFYFFLRGGLMLIGAATLKRAAGYGASLTIYSALFFGLLILANYFFFRHDPLYFDSTEQKVFTLAPQTQKLLSGLKDEVVIRAFYVGGEVPEEVEGLLDRLSRASDKLSWQVVDPEKSPRLTERLGVNERDTLHFSFATGDSTREAKVVREIAEQDVANAILKLTRGGSKTVYYVFGHGESNLEEKKEAGYLFLKEAIQGENVQVKQLILGQHEAIPPDAAAVLVMAPRRPLLPIEHKLLSEYFAKGGSGLLVTEPNTVRDVAKLAAPYGIVVGDDIVLSQELRLLEGQVVGVQPVVNTYSSHPAVAGFTQSTVFSTVSSVRRAEEVPPGATVEEIAFTPQNSWVSTDLANIFGEAPEVVMPSEDQKYSVPIAAAYEAPVPEGAKDPENSEQAGEKDEPRKHRLLVIGDADFVANINIRQLFNRDFFLNSLNWVLGEQEQVSIRARTLRRSTTLISNDQFQKIFLVGGILIPELLLLWGLAIWWFRRGG